jgi:hypothetical protein
VSATQPVIEEIGFRLLTHAVALRVPAQQAGPFAARFVTPAAQDAPARATWEYRVAEEPDGRSSLWESHDRFADAGDAGEAAEVLERRVVGRAVDYFARWGWLVVAGRLVEVDGRRVLTVGGGDGSLTLLRDGQAVPLPLPFPHPGPLPGLGPLTELVVVGGPPGPVATPAALAALLAAVRAPIPGGARAGVREAMAALRGVRSGGAAR